jgi:hypothetical protein
MVSMTGAELGMTSRETGPEQLPPTPRPALAEPLAPMPQGLVPAGPLAPTAQGLVPAGPLAPMPQDRIRPLAVAQCSLCGVALPLGLLVPDGGQGCADVRWYCKDAKSCTERWTTARPPL